MYVNKRNVRVVISISRASERDTYIEGRKRQPLATSLLDIHTHSHIGILATKKFCFIEHMLKNYKLRSNRKVSKMMWNTILNQINTRKAN